MGKYAGMYWENRFLQNKKSTPNRSLGWTIGYCQKDSSILEPSALHFFNDEGGCTAATITDAGSAVFTSCLSEDGHEGYDNARARCA